MINPFKMLLVPPDNFLTSLLLPAKIVWLTVKAVILLPHAKNAIRINIISLINVSLTVLQIILI